MKVSKFLQGVKKQGEDSLASPEIAIGEKTYWVMRYGPNFLKTKPPRNYPTGYTVFCDEYTIFSNVEECKTICRLYRVWEESYMRPFKVVRSKKMIDWIMSLKEDIFKEISARRAEGYDKLEISDEERKALIELDNEVCSFHETEIELMQMEQKLFDLQLKLCEFPSESNIQELIHIVEKFRELLPIQEKYLQRRIVVWQEYRLLLEKEYDVNVKVNVEFGKVDISFAAFVDLMKYVLYEHVIPEAILTGIAWDVTNSVARAKMNQSLRNLFVHYGGLESLKAQSLVLQNNRLALDNYRNIWKSEIPSEMVRIPPQD